MSRREEAKRLALWSLGLVLAVNALVLAGVAWNRSGEPQARLLLSERELGSDMYEWMDRTENSGRSLRLNWRVPLLAGDERSPGSGMEFWQAQATWLQREQLAALGFTDAELRPDPQRRLRIVPARQAWVAFELDGPAYSAALEWHASALRDAEMAAASAPEDTELAQRLEQAKIELDRERTRASRLFAIDVEREHSVLRERYPDRTRYLLLRASIEVSFSYRSGEEDRAFGYIDRLHVAEVHVPRRWHREVEAAQHGQFKPEPQVHGFDAVVVFGRRHEPWIESLQAVVRRETGD
jgi:hypothetical protein